MTTDTTEERAARALERRQGGGATLKPIDQIRPYTPGHVPEKNAWAYYLRPEGATIADALVLYPNGGVPSPEDDPRGRYRENASYYQDRQRRKGLEYVGTTLTLEGARRLVEILAQNRPDEIERLEDEIALCEQTIANTDRPDVRDHERRRKSQLQARLARVRAPLDPEALVKELEEIANAQEMANVPPAVMRVMRRMLGQQSADFEKYVQRFTRPRGGDEDEAMHTGQAVVE